MSSAEGVDSEGADSVGSGEQRARACPSCRVTVLSRYNPGPVCTGCSRAARESRPTMPSWLWDSEPMRQALARMDPGGVLAVLRAATGLSQLELADLLGWSQSTVSLVESGRRQSLYDIRELLRFADAVDMPREALLPLVLGRPDVTLVAEDGTGVGSERAGAAAVDRRSFHGLAAGVALGGIAPGAAAPSRVDMAHVRYLRAGLGQVNTRLLSSGGGAALDDAMRLFARARSMIDDSDYTGTVGQELLTVAAEIGEVAGWSAYDQEDQSLARQVYTEAEHLASASGNAEILAHIYGNLAQQSTSLAARTGHRGRAREALRFADLAAAAARHEPSPKLHAMVALRKARAHAELGDERAFRAEIGGARRELDRGPHPSDSTLTDFVTDSEISGVEGGGYGAIGRVRNEPTARPVHLYRAVLDDPGRSPRDHAGYHAALARALLAAGDRTEAIKQGLALLPDLGERIVSARALSHLRPVRAAAEQAAAEEFCARFDAAARALAA